ncbi:MULTISPECIES: hypothetical protein [unclassified Kitasatospora]|uniref:hypothetical protein n=1 Tax=unclassified Kitasatospora TaxID=2633591 RepID=UPI00070DD8DD|nr:MULTISPECIES: hypothetical protein [unclassified Kitasatospora]KQV14534.1 hypothetical protein ASC99_30695 [Kitasatospora sp. Root107]KRB68073.1 hypothetical protein ASE03_29415 [Kitasatospora sp. Root187]
MTMQWHFEEHGGTGVLSLSGFLGERVVHRFHGAFAWACARSTGALVLDLTTLRGISADGERAIAAAAATLPADRTPLAVCGLTGQPAALLTGGACPARLRLHPDLDAALAATCSNRSA